VLPTILDSGRQVEKQAVGQERPAGSGFQFERRNARGEGAGINAETLQFTQKFVNPKQRLVFRRSGLLGCPFFQAHALFACPKPSSDVALKIRDAFGRGRRMKH
jgi:hypothetical protein